MSLALLAATAVAAYLSAGTGPRVLVAAPRALAVAAIDVADPSVAYGAVAAAAALGGGLYWNQNKDATAPAQPPAVASPPPPPATRTTSVQQTEWPTIGGTGGQHRGAGKWAPAPQRELWYPPVGGTTGPHRGAGRWPPPKPMAPPADPLAGLPAWKPGKQKSRGGVLGNLVRKVRGREKWPRVGGTTGSHRGAGRWPPPAKAATAAIAAPTPSPPPAKSKVASWYDSGVRLLGATPPPPPPPPPAVDSWYDKGQRL